MIIAVIVVINATQKTSDNISFNEMSGILNKHNERVPVRVRIRSVIAEREYRQNDIRRPYVSTGEQGENFVWERIYPACDVKTWNFGGTNEPFEGKTVRRWVSRSAYDVPFDCSYLGENADIKTVYTRRGSKPKKNETFDVLSTEQQANEITQYLVLYIIDKPRSDYVRFYLCNCTEIGA